MKLFSKNTALAVIITIITTLSIVGCSSTAQDQPSAAPQAKTPQTFNVANQTIVLKERTIFDGRIILTAPETFEKMSEDMVSVKYPAGSSAPDYILTNKEGTINIAFSKMNTKITEAQMKAATASLGKLLKKAQPKAKWLKEEVITINDRQAGLLEFITPAADTNIYNKMIIMELDGKILAINFNCTEEEMKDWQPIGTAMIDSIKLN